MDLIHILASVTFILLLIFIYLSWQYTYFQRRGIPTAKGIIPPFGHMLPIIVIHKTLGTLCEKFYNETKGYSMCGFYHLWTPILLIREPELVKNVLQTNFSSFSENPFDISSVKCDQLLKSHPFFTKGDEWKKSRAPVTNSLSAMKLKLMMPVIQRIVSRMTEYLQYQCGKEVDLKVLCNKFTGEFSAIESGIQTNNFKNTDEIGYNQMIDIFFKTPTFGNGVRLMIFFILPALGSFLNYGLTPKVVDQYFREIGTKVVNNRRKEKGNYNDYIQYVMDYQKLHHNIENEEVLAAAHMLSFAFDVYEIVAVTTSFLIMDLARRPEIQNKVREEIITILDKYNGELTYDALKEMPFFDKVLNESQRMNHLLGITMKICTKRTKLEGTDGLSCVIEPGQKVAVSIYGLQMDPKYWNEPEIFDPERFNNDEKNTRHKFTFLPFGEGPRMCVGMRIGIILVKLAVAGILKDFSVEPSKKMVFPMTKDETNFLNFPLGGFWVKIRPLKSGACSE
ncbi:probable cytochrome P450 6a13 [Leptopilina heterotoma]|uniref:probable cytochrome P450 6a13 n=1 Tax=Leptopilina heterotoma TaxID=63436 RepID=UPI001CA83712|nr:probable cytochrome P450 6a13 [Leptopilina heterotoma]